MKIADLLVRVHNLYPHSLKTGEMIDFCNEVGAILKCKYLQEFDTVLLKYGDNLPEGISKRDIIRVVADGNIIERDDLTDSGVLMYPESKRKILKVSPWSGAAEVTYRVPYLPIRYLEFTDTVTDADGGFTLTKEHDIRAGDVLITGDGDFTVTDVEVTDTGFLVKGDGEVLQGEQKIERMIDELTVTDPPYDRIYTEFLIARAARFQKDYEAENRALQNYNALLEDLERYLVRNGKRPRQQQFFNFW